MDRVAVVTGGASGIGGAITRRLAERGHKVAVFDRQPDTLKAHVAELQELGHAVSGYEVDVTDRAAVDSAVASVRREFGPIHIVVTSAGVSEFEPFTDITLEGWERTLSINLTGAFNCVQAAVSDMIAANLGSHSDHLVYRRTIGCTRPGPLRRFQGRPDRSDESAGPRVRFERNHRQHDPAGTESIRLWREVLRRKARCRMWTISAR